MRATVAISRSTRGKWRVEASKNAKNSRWPDGIPPDMGGHRMASGILSPRSTTRGVGTGPKHMFSYKDEVETSVVVYDGKESLAEGLAECVWNASNAAMQEKGSFALAVSGGSAGNLLAALRGKPIEPSKWHVFFVDERCVPLDHEDSNYKALDDILHSTLAIPKEQIYTIDGGLSAAEEATRYESILKSVNEDILPKDGEGWPVLDMVVLGVGQDGHVGSLFPNRKQTAAKEGWVLPVEDSPKPPSARITMSMPVINASKRITVVASGTGKAEICQRALEVVCLPGAIPAQLLGSEGTELCWLLDAEAAKDLSVGKWEDKKSFPRSNL